MGSGQNRLLNMEKEKYRFVILLLSFFLLISFLSCARYPKIPKVKKMKKTASPSENMGKLFQKKAAGFVPLIESKKKEYVLGPQDVLKITVWDHEDLNREVTISEDGNFSYPLIGKVHAEGLTVSGLEDEIEKRLSGKYIINPQVNVTVKEYKSKQVFVLGEVGGTGTGKGPGAYPLIGKTTLMEILAEAGGPTKDAGAEVVIIRPKKKRSNPVPLEKASEDEIIRVNLRKLLEGDMSQNILLQSNDTVYVPKAEYFYVFGEVKQPGKYILEKGITVLKAITIAGGTTEKAAINKTKIVREKDGQKIEMKAKMTDPIYPGDTIIVPESLF